MNTPDRAGFAQGLRDLADAIERDGRILLPPFGAIRISVLGRTGRSELDDAGLAEDIAAMADALGVPVGESDHGRHLSATGTFGQVTYTATSVLKASRDEYAARTSYYRSIEVAR